MAGLAGFEPTIEGSEPSALPLGYSPNTNNDLKKEMAGPAGFEPTMRESKSLALPLGYGPTFVGRLMGVEPTNVGATIRCVYRFATAAV